MEDGRHDGMISARRCLAAMASETDLKTREALWAAAKRYAQRAREEVADGATGSLSVRLREAFWGSSAGAQWNEG